jgi:signal transduction histidine kinase
MSEGCSLFLEAASRLGSGESAREMLTQLIEEARLVSGARTAALRAVVVPGRHTIAISVGGEDGKAVTPLAALVEAQAKPIRIADGRGDARLRELAPSLDPPLKSFLGVPLRLRSETVGSLYLLDKQGALEFTGQDELLIELFGAQAAFSLGLLRHLEASQERGRFFEALVAQSPDAMLFFEAPTVLRYVNPATVRHWGDRPGFPTLGTPLEPERFPWHRDGRRFTSDELPEVRAMRGEIVENLEMEVPLPDGSRFPAMASAAPVRTEAGKILGAVATFRDVSAEVELERLRAEFAAIMVHDLRNPLNALILSAENLLAKTPGYYVQAPVHVLRRMVRLGRRLGALVGELLDASRVELGQLSLVPKVVDLPSTVSELVRELAPSLSGRSVEIQVNGHPGPVFIDPLRLIQILTNLLDNSAKYSLAGAPIQVTVQGADGGAEISVSDQGPGIMPEDVPRLFDRFFQAQGAREKRQPGLGLGLYITRGLVEASGGRISVESVAGQGSTFHVWLPEAPVVHEDREAVPHQPG